MTERLPIYEIEDDLITSLQVNRRLVLQAPTGSGKSTQIPQMLLKHGLLGTGQAVILQPRRLAARLLASRVAQELGVEIGKEVGYQVRFENATSAQTRIKFETEGILLRQLIQDPSLNGIQAILFDEFHERHVYGDITLARALDIQEERRPDLIIIVMSATLDAGSLQKYMQPCVTLTSTGRTFPVTVEYLPNRLTANSPPVWELAADAFSRFARKESPGDVLVFMPGGYEIARTIDSIRRTKESRGYILLPLHGELAARDQDAAVARYDSPKIIVATNVAETSITIEGIRLVIDSGLARIPRHDPHRGINTLLIERISRASADQRTGRAGRTEAGHCIRLWSAAEHAERAAQELPEIKRLDLAEIVLTLKAAGIRDLRKFRWLESPGETPLLRAEELLLDLGALKQTDTIREITPRGHRMLAFPIHPRYSRMLIAAQESDCVYEAFLVVALTQGRDLVIRNVDRSVESSRESLFEDLNHHASSDFQILIRAWNFAVANEFRLDTLRQFGIHGVTARQVGPLLEQFLRIARSEGLTIRVPDGSIESDASEPLRKCILIGFSDRVAHRIDEGTFRCELVHGRRATLARESVVKDSSLLVAAEIREIGGRQGEVQTILSLATSIPVEWLYELFPQEMVSDVHVEFDSASRSVKASSMVRFRDLAVSQRKLDSPPAGDAARLLAEEITSGRLELPRWDHSVVQWILRLNQLSQWCPDLQLPPIQAEDKRHIIEQLCFGASSYREIRDRDVQMAVRSWLSAEQRALLDKHAPERVSLSNGRTPKVTYVEGGSPFISLRIQELFGVTRIPAIALGRMPLSVHILAPSMRPVQVTQDLANFWTEHYPKIKSELQRKYPKHEWK